MTTDAAKTPPDVKRSRQGRSPAYPGIDLKSALAKAKALYDQEGKYPAPMPSAFGAWGFSAKSSGGREVRAALRYFGLITVEGDGDAGKIKLSDKALRVLLDEREDQSEKRNLIRELALTPPIHQRIHEKFPDGIKSDATVEHYLMFDEGYNKSASSDLVSEFKSTADFAGIYKPDNMPVKADVKPSGDDCRDHPVVGDLVQVEIGGALQLEKAARVRSVQEHEGQKWVFIEGSETGIPMDQVIIQAKAAPSPPGGGLVPPRLPMDPPTVDIQLAKNEREWLRGPLSKETSYRLVVSGELGPKEIGKLIKLLEAQKLVLSEDED